MLDGILNILQPLLLIKLVVIIITLMVLIFVLIVAKQTRDMDDTIILGPSGKLVKLISYVALALSFSLLLTAIVIL